MRRLDARDTWRIALLALLWLALLAWARPLMLPDEGRYVGVAWWMQQSGDWTLPTLDGLPYFHKPPLFYWITGLALRLFGVREWAARAASLLAACGGGMALFCLLRRWWGARVAALALVALLAQPFWYLGGQFANLDMLVAGCITATIVLLAHAALLAERGMAHRRALLAAYAMAALGVLAKGLIGFVLPAAVITLWLLAGRRWRTLLRLPSVFGAGVFLAIAAPWFIAMQARFPDFLHYFFVVQHFQRFATGGFNNVQPFWFYPVALALVTLPWLPWLRPQFEKGRLADAARGDLRLLCWVWLVVIVGFFSLPSSKLLGYILPAVPPLAALLADGIDTWRGRGTRGWRWSAALSVALAMLAVAVLARHTPHSSKPLARVLHAQRHADAPVYVLDEDFFDLPVYAQLARPVVYVQPWDNPDLRHHDNWRKELLDAGGFAPTRASQLLLPPSRFPAALCAQSEAWAVGPQGARADYPFLASATQMASTREAVLWWLDMRQPQLRRALGCRGTPTAG